MFCSVAGSQLSGFSLRAERSLYGHRQPIGGQRRGGLRLLTGFHKPFRTVRAEGLQHDVAGTPVRRDPWRGQQRAVHQPQHRRPSIRTGDSLGRRQRERTGEHREPAEHIPLLLGQQLVTPLSRRRQRPPVFQVQLRPFIQHRHRFDPSAA